MLYSSFYTFILSLFVALLTLFPSCGPSALLFVLQSMLSTNNFCSVCLPVASLEYPEGPQGVHMDPD